MSTDAIVLLKKDHQEMRKLFQYGGIAASIILIAFGI